MRTTPPKVKSRSTTVRIPLPVAEVRKCGCPGGSPLRTTPPKVTTRLTSLHTNLRCGSTWLKHLAEVPGGSARPHFTAQGHLPSSHWRRPQNTQDQGHVTARTKVNPYPQGYTRSQYLVGFQSTHPTLFRNAEGAPLPAEALSLRTLWQKPRKSQEQCLHRPYIPGVT